MEVQETLNSICTKIFKENALDNLEVMYRTERSDGEDLLFGYCTVQRKLSGFAISSCDGDNYSMSDIIEKYEYNPPYFKGLVVWFKTVWSDPYRAYRIKNKELEELLEDLALEQKEQM